MFDLSTKILIVDDMTTIRDMVKGHLREMGYQHIDEAQDGAQAHEKLKNAVAAGQPYGLVISDWNMPKKTGFQLLKDVRGDVRLKSTPFVLLTAESEKEQVTEAILAGVNQYIIKPFSQQILVTKLESVWQKLNS